MEAAKILRSDFLDLLFDGRNKDYGAYELRNTYNRRIATALGVTLGAVVLLSLSSFFAGVSSDSAGRIIVTEVAFSPPPTDPLPLTPPPPLQPASVPPDAAKTKFTLIDIVKDDGVSPHDMPPDADKLDGGKIDVITQAGSGSTDLAVPGLVESKGVVVIKKDVEDDGPFTSVEVEANFPGGMTAWRTFLQRSLSAEVATSAGAPPGSYKVVVQFIVDIEGKVSDVQPLTSYGYGMEEEAVRVIRRSGNWIPALQNGRAVKAYRRQPVTFVVSEE